MKSVTHYNARVGALSRSRCEDDSELLAARRDLRAAKLAAYVSKVVAEAPPLTNEQIDRIAVLLRPNSRGAAA
ncbi:hypothetical protein ABH924_000151 [Arthrobacter sp. GAS37]|uniref:hypothetical protein n=1 Tax=Arthrobacter sp. GAS37 TaxID=3156261 RepID=UPI0038368A11